LHSTGSISLSRVEGQARVYSEMATLRSSSASNALSTTRSTAPPAA